MTISFSCAGLPATQGSKRAFVVKGRAVLTEAGGEKHRSWREAVAAEARQVMVRCDLQPLAGPVVVVIDFLLPKPASAPKRRASWPIGARSGDIDKLCRSILDSLTSVVFGDDSQVVHLVAGKLYAEDGWTGVRVKVGVVVDVGI